MAAFTTIATGIGLAVTAGTTGMSFAQAGKQNKLKRQAEDDAAQAMAAARKKLDVNFYEQLAIKKEPYELAREASLVQGAEALQAGVEGEQRGAGAVAGRVQMAQNQQQGNIRSAMGQELMGLEQATATEESRLRDKQVGIDLAEVQGAQLAARDAQEAATQATQQGMEGVASFATQALNAVPLFSKSPSARITNQIQNTGSKNLGLQQTDIQKSIGSLGVVDNIDFSRVGGMTPLQFTDFMGQVNPETLKKIQAQFPGSASAFNTNGLPGTGFSAASYGYGIPSIGG
jgi:hypothetical protein